MDKFSKVIPKPSLISENNRITNLPSLVSSEWSEFSSTANLELWANINILSSPPHYPSTNAGIF
jgi:hypothetical protein